MQQQPDLNDSQISKNVNNQTLKIELDTRLHPVPSHPVAAKRFLPADLAHPKSADLRPADEHLVSGPEEKPNAYLAGDSRRRPD